VPVEVYGAITGSGDCPVTDLISEEPENQSEAARVASSETAVAFLPQHLTYGLPGQNAAQFANPLMATARNGRPRFIPFGDAFLDSEPVYLRSDPTSS
jgi:hypothetical protein